MIQIGKEHGKPHIHAIYDREKGTFDIETAQIIEGKMSAKHIRIVQKFVTQYREELLEMWNNKSPHKINI